MSKLIYADLARMIKSRIFWITEIFMTGYCVFAYAMARIDVQNNIDVKTPWTVYFFHGLLFIVITLAVFAVAFIGAEYSDGPIRNKIAAGYTRQDIFLSNLIICYIVGVIQFLTYCITSVISGLLLVGSDALTQLNKLPWRIGYSLLIILVYAVIFTMIAMLDSNRARTMAVGLLSALVFYMLLSQIYADLQQPELTNRVIYSATGELQIEENIPNRKFVSGTKRTVYEWIDTFLPLDQAMYVLDDDTVFSLKAPLCMLSESLVFVGIGIYFFKRKDIK